MNGPPDIDVTIECQAHESYTRTEAEIVRQPGPGDAIDLLRYVIWKHNTTGPWLGPPISDWIGPAISFNFETSKAAETLGWDVGKVAQVWLALEQITLLAIWEPESDYEGADSVWGRIIYLSPKRYQAGVLLGGTCTTHPAILAALRESETLRNIYAQFEGQE